MQISRTEGFFPVPAGNPRPVSAAGGDRVRRQDGCCDKLTLSSEPGGAEEKSFRTLVADLANQVRTHNTTGKIQELRRQVGSGEYRVSPRELAVRMLLMEEGE